jgi:hypothetical protein
MTKKTTNWIWLAPEYFSRWRLFPRAFISMYIYLLYDVVNWFMLLPDPNSQQAGLVSVLYVNSNSTKYEELKVTSTTIEQKDTREDNEKK